MGRRGRKGEAISLLTVCGYARRKTARRSPLMGPRDAMTVCHGLRARQHILVWSAQAVTPSYGPVCGTLSQGD